MSNTLKDLSDLLAKAGVASWPEMARRIAQSRERLAKAIAAPLLSPEIEEQAKTLYEEGRIGEAQAAILEGLRQEEGEP